MLGSSPVWEPPSTAAPVTQRGSDPSPSSSPPGPDSRSVREESLSSQDGLAHDFEAISIEPQPSAPAHKDSTNAADQDLSSTPHISPSLHQLQEPFEEGQAGERLPRSQSGSSIASSSHSSYLGGSGRRAKRQADATSGEGAAGPSAWNRGSSQMASISSPPPQSPSKSNRPRSSSFNTPSPSSSRPQTADAMSPPSSSLKERPRSSTWRSPSAAVSNIDDATQTTPRSSFTMLARSASRRSVYSAFNFVDHSAEPMPSSSTSSRINRDELPPSPPKERRRLFSRSRSSLPVSDGSNATQTSPMLRAQPGGSGGGGSNGKGIVRRISSRTFFGKERDRSNDEAMRSTDSLASTSSTARQETGAKKTGGMLGRTATLPNWAKKKKGNKGSDASETSEGPQGLARASMESYASVTSSAATGPPPPPPVPASSPPEPETLSNSSRRLGLGIAEEEEESQQRSKPLHPPNLDQSEEGGLPRRLSGWLLNMIGSEGVQPSPGLSVSPPTRPDTSQQKGPSSSDLADTNVTSPSTSALSTSPTSGARTKAGGGILSSLSNTGRNRTDGATGGVGNSARSGLDRALRYFLDSGEQNDDEGIWLLGVWHGPKTDVVSPEQRQQQQQQVHGPSIEISGASPRAPKTAQQGASKATVGSESSSSPLHHHMDLDGDDESSNSSARRTRETSPSIASASTGGSLGRKAKRPSTPEPQVEVDDGNDHVVARNPPTPQTSPVPGHSRSSNGTSAGTPFVSAPTRGASASSSVHDKTLPAGPSFQVDFCSRVWCTYRSHFVPIARDGSISSQAENAAAEAAQQQAAANADAGSPATPIGVRTGWLGRRTGEGNASTDALGVIVSPSQQQSGLGASLGIPTPSGTSPGSHSGGGSLGEKMGIPNLWGRATAAAQAVGLGGRSGLTTDAGWGCMLRTGQSVLANALIDTHLGRDWRRQGAAPSLSNAAPSIEEDREAHDAWRRARTEYASYVRIISWFMDEPSLACPFGVHRMAREGKRLGKEVGEWFGPSTAAGAIKKLVDEYPHCGIGVSVATDGAVYLDQVRQAAQTPGVWPKKQWSRPVLILIGIRLGLDGVHPTYYESVKVRASLFSFFRVSSNPSPTLPCRKRSHSRNLSESLADDQVRRTILSAIRAQAFSTLILIMYDHAFRSAIHRRMPRQKKRRKRQRNGGHMRMVSRSWPRFTAIDHDECR